MVTFNSSHPISGSSVDLSSEYVFESVQLLNDGESIESPWIDMSRVDKYQFEGVGSSTGSGFDQVISSSSLPSGSGSSVDSVSRISERFRLFNATARQRYIKFTWTNMSGSDVSGASLAIKVTYGSSDKLSVTPLGNQPLDFSQAALVRSVQSGQQPDGDYVNSRQDGSAFSTNSSLPATGSYISPWVDTDGWSSIRVFVRSDVESSADGLVIEFSGDTNATIPDVLASRKYRFGADDIERGFVQINLPPVLDGFRVVYTNGPVPQSYFYVDATLRISGENASFNKAGAMSVNDFLTEVALGEVSNYMSGTKFGRVTSLGSGSTSDVWNGGGTYTGHPVGFTPQQIEINSTSGNDNSTGSGARTVEITGLRSPTSPLYETQTMVMNGTTRVTSPGTWWRINRVRVTTAGTGGSNQGIIEVRASSTTSVIFARMPVGFNSTTIAAWTVPSNRTALIKKIRASVTRANGSLGSATVSLRVRAPGSVYQSVRVFELQTGGGVDINLLGGVRLEAGTDLKFRVDDVSDGGSIVESAIEYVLIG